MNNNIHIARLEETSYILGLIGGHRSSNPSRAALLNLIGVPEVGKSAFAVSELFNIALKLRMSYFFESGIDRERIQDFLAQSYDTPKIMVFDQFPSAIITPARMSELGTGFHRGAPYQYTDAARFSGFEATISKLISDPSIFLVIVSVNKVPWQNDLLHQACQSFRLEPLTPEQTRKQLIKHAAPNKIFGYTMGHPGLNQHMLEINAESGLRECSKRLLWWLMQKLAFTGRLPWSLIEDNVYAPVAYRLGYFCWFNIETIHQLSREVMRIELKHAEAQSILQGLLDSGLAETVSDNPAIYRLCPPFNQIFRTILAGQDHKEPNGTVWKMSDLIRGMIFVRPNQEWWQIVNLISLHYYEETNNMAKFIRDLSAWMITDIVPNLTIPATAELCQLIVSLCSLEELLDEDYWSEFLDLIVEIRIKAKPQKVTMKI